MTLYVLWLIITNDSSWIPGILFGFTPFGAWMLLEANRLFGFCLTHKLMIYHIFLVYFSSGFETTFGILLQNAHTKEKEKRVLKKKINS